MLKILAVGLGGFVGTVCRYSFSLIPSGNTQFPWQTFVVNIVGAFVIGVFVQLALQIPQISEYWVLFVRVGVCGGFTTFSAFSLEAINLLEKGQWRIAVCYIVLSIFLCLLFVWTGKRISAHFQKP